MRSMAVARAEKKEAFANSKALANSCSPVSEEATLDLLVGLHSDMHLGDRDF